MAHKVAVLMGGQSFEREFSLSSGKHVCEVLQTAGHEVLPLDTTSDLVESLRRDAPDVAYIALHGKHGEDGTIQSLLEFLRIPYVGCTAPVCRMTRNKSNIAHVLAAYRRNAGLAKGAPGEGGVIWTREACIAIDAFKEMGAAGALDLAEERIGYPMVVKPACGGSAMGLHKVKGHDELAPAILDALSYDDAVIIGEWVSGVEVGVSVVDWGEGEPTVLPPVEICTSHEYFDTSDRVESGAVEFHAPPRAESLSGDACAAVEAAAREAFMAFGCRDLARVDMIWDGATPKIIEVDVSPGMSEHSLLPAACMAADVSLGELLSKLLDRAVARQE